MNKLRRPNNNEKKNRGGRQTFPPGSGYIGWTANQLAFCSNNYTLYRAVQPWTQIAAKRAAKVHRVAEEGREKKEKEKEKEKEKKGDTLQRETLQPTSTRLQLDRAAVGPGGNRRHGT